MKVQKPTTRTELIKGIRALLKQQEARDIKQHAKRMAAGEIKESFCSLDRYGEYRRECLTLAFERELRNDIFFELSGVTLEDVYQQLEDRLNGVHLAPETLCYRSITNKEGKELLATGSVLFHGYGYSQASLISFYDCIIEYGNPDLIDYCGIIIEILTGGKFKFCEEYFYESRVVTETKHQPKILRVCVRSGVSEWSWFSVDEFRNQHSPGE